MNTFLTATELQDLANVVLTYNDYFKETGLTLETRVVDANGEYVGDVRWNANDSAYVFLDDASVLD